MVHSTQVKAVVVKSHNSLEVVYVDLGVVEAAYELGVVVKWKVEEMAAGKVGEVRRNDTV